MNRLVRIITHPLAMFGGLAVATAISIAVLVKLMVNAPVDQVNDWVANGLIAYVVLVFTLATTLGAERFTKHRAQQADARHAQQRLDLLLDRVLDEIQVITRRARCLRTNLQNAQQQHAARTNFPDAMWRRMNFHLDEIEDAALVFDLDEFYGRVSLLHKAESDRVRHLLDHPDSDLADQGVLEATGRVLAVAPQIMQRLDAACGDYWPRATWLPVKENKLAPLARAQRRLIFKRAARSHRGTRV